MKVLTTSTESQTLKVIPREYVPFVNMYLRDDSTNLTTTITPNVQNVGNYMEISNTFNFLKEGRFYDLKIVNIQTQKIIYRDKVFCTDQTINQDTNDYYSVNKNEYVSKSGNNDYIVL